MPNRLAGSHTQFTRKAAASALNGEPSWKVTPWRRWNRQVSSSTGSQLVASIGLSSPVTGLIVVSCSITLRRPTALTSLKVIWACIAWFSWMTATVNVPLGPDWAAAATAPSATPAQRAALKADALDRAAVAPKGAIRRAAPGPLNRLLNCRMMPECWRCGRRGTRRRRRMGVGKGEGLVRFDGKRVW